MRKAVYKLMLCLILAIALFACTVSVSAMEPVDTERPASLTLQYRRGEECFEGLTVKTYRIADVYADGTFQLCGAFRDYPISIYGITTAAEWKTVAATLDAYTAGDAIAPDLAAETDSEGKVAFEDISAGMYLTLGIRVENEGVVTIFETFLTVIPQTTEEGHNYDITAYPKCSIYEPTPDEVEYKVIKQWKDGGNDDKRPEFIEIDILCDGEKVRQEKLSTENDWSYSWSAPDNGAKWQAVERNVPDGYTVTVSEKGSTIVVTNSYEGNAEKPPQTGDSFVILHYVIPMAVSGAVILILAVCRRRKEA